MQQTNTQEFHSQAYSVYLTDRPSFIRDFSAYWDDGEGYNQFVATCCAAFAEKAVDDARSEGLTDAEVDEHLARIWKCVEEA